MYLWVKDIFGSRSGIVSAVAYMAAPYILIDALVRGNQPESMALALFPLILWASRRFILKGNAASFLIATLSLALLALSHNISTMLFVPFLFVYLIGVGWASQISWKPIAIRLVLLFGLGLGLAAFYLGPALLELDEITISQSVSNRNNDFRFNFATLGEIFSSVKAADPALLNPPLLLRLGWVPAALGLLGLVSLKWARSRERRGHIIFMALSAIFLLLMALPASLPIWENLPLIEFVQFPWRFIGRAALPAAFLAGVPFAYLPNRSRLFNRTFPLAALLTMLAVVFLILESTPHLYPHNCSEEPYPTINTVHAYERSSGLVGVDPAGSYFPKSVKVRPDGSTLEKDYLADRPPQRFDLESLPNGSSVEQVEYTPLSARMTVNGSAPFQARYLTFAYPGWEAAIDGQEVSITASDPGGLITFAVPAGEHSVEVSWHMTPSRTVLTAISIIAAVLIVIVAAILYRKGPDPQGLDGSEEFDGAMPEENGDSQDRGEASSRTPSSQQIDLLSLILLVAAGVALLFFKTLVVDHNQTFLRQETLSPVDFQSEILGGELGLIGYSLSQESVAGGDSFDVDLAWRVLEPPQADYQSNIWLVGSDGMIWSDKETNRPRTYEDTAPSRFWLPGQWAWDSRDIEVLAGTPPGEYDIVLILFDRDTLSPLTLLRTDGLSLGPDTVIGQIEVTLTDTATTLEAQYEIESEIDGLTLAGYNQDRQEASPGEPVLLTLFWKKRLEDPNPIDVLNLALTDSSGDSVQQWLIPPVSVDYPPDYWPVDQSFRGQHVVQLAPDLKSGAYIFKLEGTELGRLNVSELDRLFDEPGFDSALQANFDNRAELVGITVEPSDIDSTGPIVVTLVWRGLAEMPVSYRVFVHMVNERGEIVAQSDGVPAEWIRPTTGWIAGEYIVDSHLLDPESLVDGQRYELRIGLYDPATGARLTTNGEEFIIFSLTDSDS